MSGNEGTLWSRGDAVPIPISIPTPGSWSTPTPDPTLTPGLITSPRPIKRLNDKIGRN